MKLASTFNRIRFLRREQTEDLSLGLLSELLAAILVEQDEEILVQARSQNFLYDPHSGMKRNDSLKVTVEKSRIVEKGSSVEINLSGTVENQLGQRENCTLYFFLWWDNTRDFPMRSSYGTTLQNASLLIEPGNSALPLSDSVFELDLHRKEPFREQEFLGQGRGYLVYGRKS